ncbi:DUF4870 family protein [Thalassospira lucentensis]|uniref:DUF4870 domain-containing protein n=1 Tax=Thalassospira lucentensis TaxID=168935 RepID=A0A358HVB9_9PROT|nr:hypothetical protein [Thalassospira lucentensis]HBU99116.1 hypothetical protein [Thalassospira lucentensis]HCW68797.1 hypothetical protein [Thalassospira lucentensis]
MSDQMHGQDASFNSSTSFVDERGGNTALVCYGLMIATLFTAFATGLIALIVAYVSREDDNHWTNSHYTFLIRTFWISILYAILTGFFFVVIGWVPLIGWAFMALMGLYTTAWFIGRNVIGLLRALGGRPIDNPRSWFFG